MLHWLQQKLTKYCDYISFSIFISCIIHVVLLGIIFFGYKSGIDMRFSLQTSKAAVVRLLPLGAIKPTYPDLMHKGIKNNTVVKNSLQSDKIKQKSKAEKKQKKTSIKKESKKKKNSKSIQSKQIQQEVKEAEPLPILQENKQQEVLSQNSPIVDEVKNSMDINVPEQDVVYVTQKELDALQLQYVLQEALEQVWQAPVGMPEETECEVMVTVGFDGTIVDVAMMKATGSYIYDSAVQTALDRLVLPQPFFGKTIAITFKP